MDPLTAFQNMVNFHVVKAQQIYNGIKYLDQFQYSLFMIYDYNNNNVNKTQPNENLIELYKLILVEQDDFIKIGNHILELEHDIYNTTCLYSLKLVSESRDAIIQRIEPIYRLIILDNVAIEHGFILNIHTLREQIKLLLHILHDFETMNYDNDETTFKTISRVRRRLYNINTVLNRM